MRSGSSCPMSIQVVAGFFADRARSARSSSRSSRGSPRPPSRPGWPTPARSALLTADAVPRRGTARVDEGDRRRRRRRGAVGARGRGVGPAGHRSADAAGRDHRWDELVARQSAELEAPALDPETPMMVIYTSGTTGRPKGAVHVHGGFLVKIAEEARSRLDIGTRRPLHVGDGHGLDHGAARVVVGAGAAGATLVLSEGAPDYPGPGRLWEHGRAAPDLACSASRRR